MVSAPARANVYPSGLKVLDDDLNILTCDPVAIRYVLNENADGDGVNPGVTVKIRRAGDGTVVRTVAIVSQAKGMQVFIWDKKDDLGQLVPDGDYKVDIVTADDGYAAWTLISTDSVQNNFGVPMGVAVNTNPASPYYGRIYVSQGNATKTVALRPMNDGVYVMNADFSDAVGQGDTALTGGVDWGTSSSNSPLRLALDGEDRLYIGDWSDAHAGLWVADPDVIVATEVLDSTDRSSTGLNGVHGSISDMIVLGTGAERVIYTIDEDFLGGGTADRAGSIWMYPIGTAAMTSTPPTVFYDDEVAQNRIVNYTAALVKAADGTFWVSQYRSGIAGELYPSLMQLDASGAILWSSVPELAADSLTDPLRGTQSIAFDPAARRLVLATNRAQTTPTAAQGLIIIFNTDSRSIEASFFFDTASSTTNTDSAFDAAGNVYVANRSKERVRVWSPPTGVHSFTTTSPVFRLSGAGAGGPTIHQQPAGVSICSNGSASFAVSATGSGTLKYRWNKNGTELPGQSGNGSPTLALTGVTASDHNAQITVNVCDDNGVTVSQPAVLTIFGVPTISTQPLGAGYRAGDAIVPLTLVAASGVTTDPVLSYQWKRVFNGTTTPVGTDSPTLELGTAKAADHGVQYLCEVTDWCGNTTTSDTITLNILPKLCNFPWADGDDDGDVDQVDFGAFQLCYTGAEGGYDAEACGCFDRDRNGNIDHGDLALFVACADGSGPDVPADAVCGAHVLYRDDFDSGASAGRWTLKTTSADSTVNFDFDYGGLGIPSAPRSMSGSRKGVFMSVNDDGTGTTEAAIAYADSADLSGDYTLSFDLWLNYGTGNTTEFAVFGINGDGSSIVVPTLGVNGPPAVAGTGPTLAGYLFAVTGDGGTVRDYRAYDGVTELIATAAGFQAASGSQDSAAALYTALFPAPRSFIAGSPGNTGGNGWGWARVDVVHAGGLVTWRINDTILAARAASSYPSGKILIGYMDMFTSISQAASYVVYDNVIVTAP